MAVLEPYKGGYYLWKFLPSVPGAVIFAILFLAITVPHVWRIVTKKTWFCIPFALGGLMEVIGFATRASAHEKTGQLMPYAIQNTMILLAPVLLAASIYMTLGRTIRNVHGEKHSLIKPSWLTKIFVSGDVFSLMIQGGAAGLMVTGGDKATLGQNIIVGGLVFQVLIFGLFCATAMVFHLRMRADPMVQAAERMPELQQEGVQWKQTVKMLYVVSALIMGRSVFRVIEFSMGHDGYLLSNEWPLYVFDAVPMFAVMAIFWWWFPSTAAGAKKRGTWGSVTSMSDLQPGMGHAESHGSNNKAAV
ncbi:RTA1 like protein-domain-containing protein [Podospora didyma]|uniref:RTA1 like protein-domain-containing protein n=1 Tax=Podospora didyma TaxID=330526 RepID=A0AAE0K0E5_9PEZI|nr:RTA1 like protein-domain-containing protein [Podospora didyma]